MQLRHFVIENKDIFIKGAKEVYETNKLFIKQCIKIKEYKCPDVFEEMKQENQILTNTKFFIWWSNRRREAKIHFPPDTVIEKTKKVKVKVIKEKTKKVKKIKKIKVKKVKPPKVKKVKEIKVKPPKPPKKEKVETINESIKEITKLCEDNTENNNLTHYQEININAHYNFQTELSKKIMQLIENDVKDISKEKEKRKDIFKKQGAEISAILENAVSFYKLEYEKLHTLHKLESNSSMSVIKDLLSRRDSELSPESAEYNRLTKTIASYKKSFFENQKQFSKLETDVLYKYKIFRDIVSEEDVYFNSIKDGYVKIQLAIRGIIENEKELFNNDGLYKKEIKVIEELDDKNNIDIVETILNS